jgi:hypothetical protein
VKTCGRAYKDNEGSEGIDVLDRELAMDGHDREAAHQLALNSSKGKGRGTHLSAMVAKGNFLAPICSQVLSFLRAVNHSSAFMPVIIFLPVDRQKRLANVRSARRVLVSFTFESV